MLSLAPGAAEQTGRQNVKATDSEISQVSAIEAAAKSEAKTENVAAEAAGTAVKATGIKKEVEATEAETTKSKSSESMDSTSTPASSSGALSMIETSSKEAPNPNSNIDVTARAKGKYNNNAVFWGGVDESFYNKPIKMFPVTQQHYWALDLFEFRIGNQAFDILTGEEIKSSVHVKVKGATSFIDASGSLVKERMVERAKAGTHFLIKCLRLSSRIDFRR